MIKRQSNPEIPESLPGKFQRPMSKRQKVSEISEGGLERFPLGDCLAFGVLRFGVFIP
jgi:hypothetical protein